MTVSSNGTPVAVSDAGSNSPSATGTWPTGSSPAAGDLIVAVVTIYGESASATLTITPPAGYSLDVSAPAASRCLTAIYTKTATGSDSAPTFTGTVSTGTAADSGFTLTIYDLSDSSGGTPSVSVTGTFAGTTSATIGPVTTSGNVPSAGCLAITSMLVGDGTTSAARTFSTPTNWTLGTNTTGSLPSQMTNFWTSSSSVLVSGDTATVSSTRTTGSTNETTGAIAVFGLPPVTSGPPVPPLSGAAGARVFMQRAGTAIATLLTIPVAAPPVTPATAIPLHQPVAAAARTVQLPGRAYGRPGVRDQAGPAVIPLRRPVAAVRVQNAPRGRAYGIRTSGVRDQTGPPAPLLHRPVAAAVRILAPRGSAAGRAATRDQTGPHVPPLTRPVAAARRILPPRGTAQGRAGTYTAPQPQATAYPRSQPARASLPLPLRGVTASYVAVPLSYSGPPVLPLRQPVSARLTPPQRGRASASVAVPAAVPVSTTAAIPLRQPVKAFRQAPPRGYAAAMAALPVPVTPSNLTVAYPLTQPVRARQPLPPRGTAHGTVTVAQAAPYVQAVTYPPHGPVRAHPVPLLPGWGRGRAGVYSAAHPAVVSPLTRPVQAPHQAGPHGYAAAMAALPVPSVPFVQATAYPLTRPVATPDRRPARPGYSRGMAGTLTQVTPAPPLSQPAGILVIYQAAGSGYGSAGTFTPVPNRTVAYPLHRPAAAVTRPLPDRGRTAGRTGIRAQQGPAIPPPGRPVQARRPLPPSGRTAFTPPYVPPVPPPPVTAVFAFYAPQTAWRTGQIQTAVAENAPQQDWQVGSPAQTP